MHVTAFRVLVIVVVVVLALSRIIKSVVTGQAPVTLELRNTPLVSACEATDEADVV